MNPKKCPTILHTQFNHHTLPVTPFNQTILPSNSTNMIDETVITNSPFCGAFKIAKDM